MKRFRIQDNVPDNYVKQSRDFQLMCNLFDLVNNGVKFDIDTITSLSNTMLCRESMLSYLQHKLGFYSTADFTDETLRTILKCFPYVVNYKGSRRGIIEAIKLFLNIIHVNCKHSIDVYDPAVSSDPSGDYVIQISLESNCLKELDILDNILKYVLPTGYILTYNLELEPAKLVTDQATSDEVRITFVSDYLGSGAQHQGRDADGRVTGTKDNGKITLPGVIGAIGTTTIRISDIAPSEEDSIYKKSEGIFGENNLWYTTHATSIEEGDNE